MKSVLLTALFVLTIASAQKVPNFLYINTPILKPGEMVSGTLDENDGQNLKDGSRLEVIQGRYMKGEVLEFNLTSTFDGYLTMYAPDKTILTYNDDTSSSESGDYLSSIVTEIPESGRYVFIISGYTDYDLGDYELSARTLEVSEEGPITIPAEQNGVLSLEDDIAEFNGGEDIGSLGELSYDSYTFELTEATTVKIEVSSASLDTIVEVLDAEGNQVAFNDDQSPEDNLDTPDVDESLDYTVEAGVEVELEPGTYEIRAGAYATGFYTLAVSAAE
jgi:Bacterial pre-peptidase C-terminal domain